MRAYEFEKIDDTQYELRSPFFEIKITKDGDSFSWAAYSQYKTIAGAGDLPDKEDLQVSIIEGITSLVHEITSLKHAALEGIKMMEENNEQN